MQDELISRQAVLEIVERVLSKGDALFEIEKLPPVTPQPCEDCISRQYLLDNCIVDKVTMPYVPVNKIKNAPSVTQQPKTGHWIHRKMDNECWEECSECHVERAYPTLYCPDCGTKMEVEK